MLFELGWLFHLLVNIGLVNSFVELNEAEGSLVDIRAYKALHPGRTSDPVKRPVLAP